MEIEIRAVIADPEPIKRRLVELGFIFESEWEQIDIMLDKPDAELFRSGRKIRIRIEPGHTELTYKGTSSGDLTASRRLEFNLPIPEEQVEQYKAFFEALGYPECFRIPKKRQKYRRGSLIATIDRWPIIGWVMEIEGSEEEAREVAQAVAPDVTFANPRLKDLLRDCEKTSGKTILQLIEEYRVSTGIDLGHLELILEE